MPKVSFRLPDDAAHTHWTPYHKRHERPVQIPFYAKNMTVLSPWNKLGIVRKAFKDKRTHKVIVMVAYYAKDLPPTWEIGGQHFPNTYRDPYQIIVIGHGAEQVQIVDDQPYYREIYT